MTSNSSPWTVNSSVPRRHQHRTPHKRSLSPVQATECHRPGGTLARAATPTPCENGHGAIAPMEILWDGSDPASDRTPRYGCSSGSATPTTTNRPPVSSTTAGKSSTPTFVITPSSSLHNGQVVLVSVSCFPPGKARLSECAQPSDANQLGCGPQPAAQPFIVIEGSSGSSSFTVSDHATNGPLRSEPLTPCSQCVLVATKTTGGFLTSPISFSS
jgi:hypothetical protein